MRCSAPNLPHTPVTAVRLIAFRGEFDETVELPEEYQGLIPPRSA